MKLLLVHEHSLAESFHESQAVAKQLNEAGSNGEHANVGTFILKGGIRKDEQGKYQQGKQKPAIEESQQNQQQAAQGKEGGQQMHRLKGPLVSFVQVDPGNARIVNLLKKLSEVGSPFMINESSGEEPGGEALADDAYAEIQILTKPEPGKAAGGMKNVLADAHVEASGVKTIHFFFSSPYPTGGKERRHRVTDGLLYGLKRGMGSIGPSKGIHTMAGKLPVNFCQVICGYQAIRIEEQQVFSLSPLRSIIAGGTRPLVVLLEIANRQGIAIPFHYLLAGHLGAIFHDENLKILILLILQTVKQFLYLFGPVVDGDDDAVLHNIDASVKFMAFLKMADTYKLNKYLPAPVLVL